MCRGQSANPDPRGETGGAREDGDAAEGGGGEGCGGRLQGAREAASFSGFLLIFIRLLLSCVDSYDSEKWRIFFTFFEIRFYTIITLSHRSERKISINFDDFFAKFQ